MNGMFTLASASSSSIFGNVGCAVRELIMSKFPNNYFQYTNVSTELAFRNMRRQFGTNTDIEISKRKRPYLIIQPTYQVPDADSFLQNIPLTRNEMDIQYNVDKRYLFEVIKDHNYGYNLKFKLNRDRIEYNVTVSVSTLHQQLDIYKAMMNQIPWERSQYYTAALEAVIPKTMIRYMSKLCKMDITETPEYIPMFLKHLNSVSGYPITYKIRNASATDEYFMYYTHNLIITFDDLSIESGNKKNMVDENYDITFRVVAEFNLPGLFVLDGDIKKIDELRVDLLNKNVVSDPNDDEYIPIYTLSNLYNRYPPFRDGLQLYGSFIFHTDTDRQNIDDSVDLGCVLDGDHQRMIKLHTDYGMVPETICNLVLVKNQEEQSVDKFSMNWDTMRMTIHNSDSYATYRIVIYINSETINSGLVNTRMSGPYDASALKDNTIDYSSVENTIDLNVDNQDPILIGDAVQLEPVVESTNISEEDEDQMIKKYSSTIFDSNTSSLNVNKSEATTSKYSSSVSKVSTESSLIFTDSPNKITLNVIDTWAKIISNAILYNYAAKIAMEENNNFSIDTLPNI